MPSGRGSVLGYGLHNPGYKRFTAGFDRLTEGESVSLRPACSISLSIAPATPSTLLYHERDPMWMGYVGRNSETELGFGFLTKHSATVDCYLP